MAFFLLNANKNKVDNETLRQNAIRAAQDAQDSRKAMLSTATIPSNNNSIPKTNSATVDIMSKRDVSQGPYRPPRTVPGTKIEIHFGCLPSGDVELPSDDERDDDDDTDNTNTNTNTKDGSELLLPSVKTISRSNFGLQIQETVTHFSMNIGPTSTKTINDDSNPVTTSLPPPAPSSTSSSSSISLPSKIRPDLVTTGGRVGNTSNTGSIKQTKKIAPGTSLYDRMVAEEQATPLNQKDINPGQLDPETHSVTTIKETDIAPSRKTTASTSSSNTSDSMNSKQGSPFVLAPVQTIAEEMVRISELRRDNPKLAQKIMMQGSMLVDLATNGSSNKNNNNNNEDSNNNDKKNQNDNKIEKDVYKFEEFLKRCKPGEFLQWHIVKALQGAATEGHLEIVKAMVRNGAPLRGPNGKSLGILTACIENGAEECGNVIQYLIQECKFNVDASTPPEYYTHLHDACMRLDYPTVKLLIELGAGVNSIAADDAVPLGLVLARAKAATPPLHVLTRTGAEVAAFQRSGQPQMAKMSIKLIKQAKQIEEYLRKKGARETWRRV
jgi:hypothetical protein